MSNYADIKKVKRAALLLSGLTLYRKIAEDDTVQAFQCLLDELINPEPNFRNVLVNYHRFCNLAIENAWPHHLLNLILQDVNPFTRQASSGGAQDPNLSSLAARDLGILQEIAELSSDELKNCANQVLAGTNSIASESIPPNHADALLPINWPHWDHTLSGAPNDSVVLGDRGAAEWLRSKQAHIKQVLAENNWSKCINELTYYHRKVGSGLFARYVAFNWQGQPDGSCLSGIVKPDPITLDQMIGLKQELQVILENTSHLLKGLPANNLILYGNRGTGKSTVIKALLHAYVEDGLRLVELPKAGLAELTTLVQQLGEEPQKFIVFIDDLSFDEGDADYKSLKTILEGTLAAKPANVLIYATSNRRHLIKEQHSDRQENELHLRDGLEEKLSLADRFGITITFLAPDQAKYLDIVEGLAKQRNLAIDSAELRQMAVRWELHHNGRSGRTARQFIDYLTATMSA